MVVKPHIFGVFVRAISAIQVITMYRIFLKVVGGYPSGNSVVMHWKYSQGHLLNMLNSDIHSGAVGIAEDYATFLVR